MKTGIEACMDLVDAGNYFEAFEAFKLITEDDSVSNIEKSDAFNMMGAICIIDPSVLLIDPGVGHGLDESGLAYYVKALEFNPKNIDTLHNLIGDFGLSLNSHSNIALLDYAIRTLKEINNKLSSEQEEMVNHRIELIESLIKEWR
jgi:hypothetical protein